MTFGGFTHDGTGSERQETHGQVMDKPARVVTRGGVDMLIGTFLLAGALVALGWPVHLDAYDRWGMQINCGNGYHSQLLQATVDDLGRDRQPVPENAPQISPPATQYVDQCTSAITRRRAWIMPVAGLGGLVLILELVAWMRDESSSSRGSTSAWSTIPTDTTLQTAAQLDRRTGSHRPRSSNTSV